MNKLVQVALKVSHNGGIFTYRLANAEQFGELLGKRVKVTLKTRQLTGVIIEEAPDTQDDPRIKDVVEVIDQSPIITTQQLELMRFCADYYFNPLGACVHLAVPRNEKAVRKQPTYKSPKKLISELSLAQAMAAHEILKEPAAGFLLEGVTGSGKTHVYIKVAEATLAQNRSVLFMVPEISLTPQLVKRVEQALSRRIFVMHSNLTPSKKRDTLHELIKNEPQVLIGARSALFAPLYNLGLIVVDEEHDSSLKQDESPRYHARDLALWRAKHEGARVILGSATPSLESILNVQKGKLKHLQLNDRFFAENKLPEVHIVDLKKRADDVFMRNKDESTSLGQKMCIISEPLRLAMAEAFAAQNQVLLFLNQRGYAKFGVCYKCGHMVKCINCSVGLTYYQHRRSLTCHLCKHTEPALTTCRNCKNDSIKFLGLGTERLEEEVRTLFPDKIVVRLDRDIVQSQKRLEETLSAMHEQRADILIGTQMIAKGHDFLHVGLVGVVLADVALSMPDFRAAEKTFQLLTQVAGRAGRGCAGKAIIQTFNSEHPSIIFAQNHNVKDFIAQELSLRKRFNQPPFSRSALIRCEHEDARVATELITMAKNLLTKPALSLLGPASSPIEKINGRFRFQCLAMSDKSTTLHQALKHMLRNDQLALALKKTRARFIIDVDPQSLS